MKASAAISVLFWAVTATFIAIILIILMQVLVDIPRPSLDEPTSETIGRSAAQAAWFQVATNLLTLIGLVATVVLSLRTVSTSTAANIQSREAFVIENRAWIQFTDIHVESDFRWNRDDGNGRLKIFYKAKNVGKTVTGPVWINASLVSRNPTVAVELPLPGENAIEGRLAQGWEPMGTMLFPDEESRGTFDLELSKEEIEANAKDLRFTDDDTDSWGYPIFIKLVVDAHYDIRFSNGLGFTRRTYEIYRRDATGALTLRPSNGDVSRELLILRAAMIGSGVAS